MGFLVLNNARTTLSGAVSIGDTSLSVVDGSSFAVGSDYSYITLENNSGQIETVKLTARSGGTLTIAAPGAAYNWASGSIVECRPCSQAVAAIVEDTIHDASAETTIADGDESAIVDVSASNVLKKITWANVKATLKTYFDTLYTAVSTCLPLAGGTLTGDITMSGASIIEAEGAAVTAASSTNIWATDGNTVHVTGNTGIADFATAPQAGAWMKVIFDGTPILTQGANLNLNAGGANVTIEAGDMALVYADTTTQMDVFVTRKSGMQVVASSSDPPVRQTVLSGPVDSSGFAAFVGSTGSTTVTATGTLKATAAAGGDANYTGSITDPSWTGLSTNGTMYLFLDITSAGVVTTGSTTLAPSYQWGGTYSTVNGQNTFNIQEATMKAGNGSTADQVYRVFVGEVTVAGSVVSAITWYALMGRYASAWTATLPAAVGTVSFTHNIGIIPDFMDIWIECTTNDGPFVVGDRIKNPGQNSSSIYCPPVLGGESKALKWYSGSGTHFVPTSASFTILTAARWRYRARAMRGW